MSARTLITSGSPYESSVGFSRAVRIGNHVAVAGTAPIGPDGKPFAPGDPAEQTRRCLSIIQNALEQAGATIGDVVRTRIYLTNVEDWVAVGKAHGEVFGTVRPACTVVQVAKLIDPQWAVEIEADAIVADKNA